MERLKKESGVEAFSIHGRFHFQKGSARGRCDWEVDILLAVVVAVVLVVLVVVFVVIVAVIVVLCLLLFFFVLRPLKRSESVFLIFQ